MTEVVLIFPSLDFSPFNLNFSRLGYWKLEFEICLLFVFWSLLFEERVNSAY
jgi:hypothetical protein